MRKVENNMDNALGFYSSHFILFCISCFFGQGIMLFCNPRIFFKYPEFVTHSDLRKSTPNIHFFVSFCCFIRITKLRMKSRHLFRFYLVFPFKNFKIKVRQSLIIIFLACTEKH